MRALSARISFSNEFGPPSSWLPAARRRAWCASSSTTRSHGSASSMSVAARSFRRIRWLEAITIGSSCQWSRSTTRSWLPRSACDSCRSQRAAVVDRPVQIELLAQLHLPLVEQRLRCQDQNAFCATCEPGLSQQQSRLNRLA